MLERPLSVLLVEDDPDAIRVIAGALGAVDDATFLLDRVDRLAAAVAWLRRRSPSVILLDLHLPDSAGLDSLVVMRTHAPRTAIVVFTSHPQADGPRAIRAGAQDYLSKADTDPALLGRSLRYAVERQLLLNEMERRRINGGTDETRHTLEALGTRSPVARRLLRTQPLRETSGDLFGGLVRRYADVVARLAAGANDGVERVEDIAARLGVLNASPQDAIEMHTMAMEARARMLGPGESDLGSRALVELLKALSGFYRGYVVDIRESPV